MADEIKLSPDEELTRVQIMNASTAVVTLLQSRFPTHALGLLALRTAVLGMEMGLDIANEHCTAQVPDEVAEDFQSRIEDFIAVELAQLR